MKKKKHDKCIQKNCSECKWNSWRRKRREERLTQEHFKK